MAWHHIKLRSRRWPCIKICQAICTYQAAKHSQPPKYLAQYSMTTKGCKWLGTTSNSGAADGLASRYAKPSAPTRLPNIHNLQNTWPTTARQPKVVNGLAPHQTQKLQMALHQDMPSHLHLPGRQTFTTSKYLAQYSMTTKGCKWLGTTSNSGAADGLASRYAKPSAPTRPPNIHNLQNTWPNTAWQPKVVNGLAPHQTQEPQMALHQDMPSYLHLPGRQTFTTSKILISIQYNHQRL